MTRQEVITKVKSLGLPAGEYVVFGAAPMAVAGLREAGDIDMLVSPKLWHELRAAGWVELDKGDKDKPLTHDVFEAHNNWDFSTYSPTLEHLLASADIVDGVPFASLQEVRKWKAAWGRPKDLADVALIDAYLTAK
ncbi:hypothetical protein EYC59_02875 [Candidatus Saccharibacteria bacterium]|nr:MAG: hypothetical protein EYC59_02875 [Candidatus Saccharibacteria bacterium]